MIRKESCSFSFRLVHDVGDNGVYCMCTMIMIRLNKGVQSAQVECIYTNNIAQQKEDFKIILMGEIY